MKTAQIVSIKENLIILEDGSVLSTTVTKFEKGFRLDSYTREWFSSIHEYLLRYGLTEKESDTLAQLALRTDMSNRKSAIKRARTYLGTIKSIREREISEIIRKLF